MSAQREEACDVWAAMDWDGLADRVDIARQRLYRESLASGVISGEGEALRSAITATGSGLMTEAGAGDELAKARGYAEANRVLIEVQQQRHLREMAELRDRYEALLADQNRRVAEQIRETLRRGQIKGAHRQAGARMVADALDPPAAPTVPDQERPPLICACGEPEDSPEHPSAYDTGNHNFTPADAAVSVPGQEG